MTEWCRNDFVHSVNSVFGQCFTSAAVADVCREGKSSKNLRALRRVAGLA
jgi:hypothetical protein